MSCINTLNPQVYKYFLRGAKMNYIGTTFGRKDGVSIISKDLIGANLREVAAHRSYFANTNASKADLSHSDIQSFFPTEANFQNARLFGSDLTFANLRNTNFENADLRNSRLNNVNLAGTKFYHCKLQGANLIDVGIINMAKFGGAFYNTIEFTHDGITYPPTQFPANFDPEAAGIIEQNY